jgi:twitching motility protein PilT
MDVIKILTEITADQASDIFIVAGRPIAYKKFGKFQNYNDKIMMPDNCDDFIRQVYGLSKNQSIEDLYQCGDADFSFAIPGISRFRISAYKQRGSLAATIRIISFSLPNAEELGITPNIISLVDFKKGMILITGPAGSGKSTTLAVMIDHINKTRENHIITLEDPIEYLHRHDKSIVSQREIHLDTESYLTALRASLRQCPDVILLGELRDFETIDIAMTAAETGHLILSTLHTIGAVNTIDRIIDAFPPNQQHQISMQLSLTLRAVVSQQLVPTLDGRRVPAFEIMTVTPAIRNMIRENKIHQIDSIVASSSNSGMISMDTSLLNLYQKGIISDKIALMYASNQDLMEKRLRV